MTHRDLLRAYNERLEQGVARAELALGRAHAQSRAAESPDQSRLARLRGYRIVDLEITQGTPMVGRRVTDVQWPPSSLVIAIRRDGKSFIPTGQTELRNRDRLAILVHASHAEALMSAIGADRAAVPRQEAGSTAGADFGIQDLRAQSPRDSVILEPKVSAGSPVSGKLVRALHLGEGVLLIAIRRGTATIVPKGDTRLEEGDHVVIVTGSAQAERVREAFRSGSGPR